MLRGSVKIFIMVMFSNLLLHWPNLHLPSPPFLLVFLPWAPTWTWSTVLGTSTPLTTLAPTLMPPHDPGLLVCLSSLTQDPWQANAAPCPSLPHPLFPGPFSSLRVPSPAILALPTNQPWPISPISQSAPISTPHTSMQLPRLWCDPGMKHSDWPPTSQPRTCSLPHQSALVPLPAAPNSVFQSSPPAHLPIGHPTTPHPSKTPPHHRTRPFSPS